MTGNRWYEALCAVTGAAVLGAFSLEAGGVKVILTKVDDGNSKQMQDGIHDTAVDEPLAKGLKQ